MVVPGPQEFIESVWERMKQREKDIRTRADKAWAEILRSLKEDDAEVWVRSIEMLFFRSPHSRNICFKINNNNKIHPPP